MVAKRIPALDDGQHQVGECADVSRQSEAATMLNANECSLRSAGVVQNSGLPDLVRAVILGGASSGDT